MQREQTEDITFDELIFLILKAVDRPLTVPEIIEYLYDWQLAKMERNPGPDRFIPRPIIRMLTYLRSGDVYAALIFLGAEGNVVKRTRYTKYHSPWTGSREPPKLQEYLARDWPAR